MRNEIGRVFVHPPNGFNYNLQVIPKALQLSHSNPFTGKGSTFAQGFVIEG